QANLAVITLVSLYVGVLLYLDFFFFSSRRRHTRWPRDWSSDVCSSDLSTCPARSLATRPRRPARRSILVTRCRRARWCREPSQAGDSPCTGASDTAPDQERYGPATLTGGGGTSRLSAGRNDP